MPGPWWHRRGVPDRGSLIERADLMRVSLFLVLGVIVSGVALVKSCGLY